MSMVSQLHQLNITYNPEEDRLLLRVSTIDKQEFRLWLTRRFTELFIDALNKYLIAEMGSESGEVSKISLDWKEEELAKQANLSQKYIESGSSTFPLGNEGILAHRFVFSKLDSGMNIRILPANGVGFDFNGDHNTLHLLNKMIQDSAKAAQWQLKCFVLNSATKISDSFVH